MTIPTFEMTTIEADRRNTNGLLSLVKEAAALIHDKGEAAFDEFRIPGGHWREEETYIFVLDSEGNMLVNADPQLEGKNQLDLKDINGKPIVRGLLDVATSLPDKPEGWYHYQWYIPGGLLPRWKSSYVQQVKAPSGKSYIVGSGVYTDCMEKEFVVDMVKDAIGQIERHGKDAFSLFHDPTGPFIAKDAYIFVYDMNGVNLVLPAFPSLEGRNLFDLMDTHGKRVVRDMLNLVKTGDSGWVNYMWPKPGESVSTKKSAFVSRAKIGDEWVLVGCGVYLADAPKANPMSHKLTASELMTLVRDAAAVFEKRGEWAFPEFRRRGSRWLRDESYFFIFAMDGTRVFHAEEPETENRNDMALKDSMGRPITKMFLNATASAEGEGWVHYLWPEPRDIFPTWKSSFVKRVTFPSGKQYIIGCGIYNMHMSKAFIEDVVNRAAELVSVHGKEAFDQFRDKTGPFVFMDTYVFVQNPDGIELVNPAQPTLEGRNLMDLKDLRGKAVVRDEIEAAINHGSAWLECYWYKPGGNVPVKKHSYVRKVEYEGVTYVVGSGLYEEEGQ
jgi:signal transduction histidine kinase